MTDECRAVLPGVTVTATQRWEPFFRQHLTREANCFGLEMPAAARFGNGFANRQVLTRLGPRPLRPESGAPG